MQSAQKVKSKELFERAKQLFPGGVNSPVRAFRAVGGEPFVVARGEGPFLYDVDGNRYVDYINSWGPLVLGHAHPLVVDAIEQQARKGTSYGACCGLEAALAELIVSHFPSIELLRFVNSGTEAGMSVVRLARGYTGRDKIIKFSGCYHGHVDSLLAQAGSGVATLSLPDCAGIPKEFVQHTQLARFNDTAGVEQIFKQSGDQIAAVILEPIMGNAGFIKPHPEFLSALRTLTEKHGALLIFDEVMTGFRVALGGAQGLYKVKPDLTMLGKVIGGGLPVGAFGGRRDIMEKLAPLGPVYQAGTLSGNPLAMAAGLATLSEWTRADVFEKTASVASTIVQAFRECALGSSIPLSVDGAGTMFGYFFRAETPDCFEAAQTADGNRFRLFFGEMLRRGIYLAPSAFEAGFVSAAHEGEAAELTIAALKEVFDTLAIEADRQ